MTRVTPYWAAAVPIVLLSACDQPRPTEVAARPQVAVPSAIDASRASNDKPSPMSVFASGLDYPRGLKFGPDGGLYVAEAGRGGTASTVGQCQQVPPPGGPYTAGRTSRISRIDDHGTRTTVVDGLPSGQDQRGSVLGAADVAFVGRTLYALLDAGCGHGTADVPASVIRVRGNGTWSVLANLTAFVKSHPVANPELDDFEPDGDWYGMIAVNRTLYALDANQGNLVSVSPENGKVRRVIDISRTQGHVVPTALTSVDGHFYVGNLTTFPAVPGSAKVFSINRGGKLTIAAEGFTTILGLAVDRRERLYVLETLACPVAGPCFPGPNTAGSGRVIRISEYGAREVIATGLTFPTGMTFGPDGALYVSNKGFGGPPGTGEIVRIKVGS